MPLPLTTHHAPLTIHSSGVAESRSQLHHDIMTGFNGEKFGGGPIIRLPWRETPPEQARHGVVSVGNFDGVHRGHLALLRQAADLARTAGRPLLIITFDPHPLQLLDSERFQPVLTT